MYVDHRIFQMVWALVPASAPEEEPEMAQEELFPARRSAPLGLHRYAVEPERPRPADPVDGSSQGEDHSLCEDPQRRQSLRSEVGTVPGGTVGLATDPDADRSQSDGVFLEGTKGTMCGLRLRPAGITKDDCQIHHRIWRSRGGSEMADNMELLHANCHRQIHVQERRTKAAASPRGAFVKA